MRTDKLAARFSSPPRIAIERTPGTGASWTPNTDVYCVEGALVIKVELAGMRKEDLELTVESQRLRISGVRRDSCRSGQQCLFVVMEINYGSFETVIEVPPGYDLTAARAAYQNGFLRVDVPEATGRASRPYVVPVEDDGDEE